MLIQKLAFVCSHFSDILNKINFINEINCKSIEAIIWNMKEKKLLSRIYTKPSLSGTQQELKRVYGVIVCE